MQMDLLLQIHIKGNKHLLSYGLDLKVITTYILLQINYMRVHAVPYLIKFILG